MIKRHDTVVLTIGLVMLLFGQTSAKDKEYNPVIDPADFVAGIDHQYLNFVTGTTFTYEGETEDGLETIVVEVTDDIRQIMGVNCTVVWDRVWLEGELIEDTYDWYAQHQNGDVWYFGEDSTSWEDGIPSTEGSWEAGVDGALPGILMKADPKPGDSYRQEYYEGEAEDMAKVLRLNASASVPYGDFEDCLKTKEWTPLESGIEHKYYSPGTGLLLEVGLKGKNERVELVDISVALPEISSLTVESLDPAGSSSSIYAFVPEPATLGLLLLGGLALLRRKR